MPKRHRHRSRTMKGGFLDTLSGWGNSISQSASSMWEKTKSTLTGSPSSSYTPTSYSPPTSYTPPSPAPMNTSTYGGKYSRRRRHKRGGGLAPVSGVKTAQPHNWVGGRTRRCTRKRCTRKTCKTHRHKH